MELYEYVERALRGQIAYLKDRDYVTVDGEVVIVDEFTGRMMPGRQWQDGLHQAIQAKERLEITLETITAARVTVQDFFKRYKKLAGMTGTAQSDAAELRRIYKVGVFKVPTNRPCRRLWYARPNLFDFRRAVPGRRRPDRGMQQERCAGPDRYPLDREVRTVRAPCSRPPGIEHQILNAKNHEIEAQIVAQAGQPGRVTVATNMAGRGTDIKLGDGVAELAACTSSGPNGTKLGASTASSPAAAPARAIRARPSSSFRLDDEIIEAFGEKHAKRVRKQLGGSGELTSLRMRRFFVAAQRKKERQHFSDRKLLMHYEKQRAEMRRNMGLNPVLG